MKRKSIRKFVNNLHLWFGLGSGIILFVVCLTGTIYTFRAEIERWVEPAKYYSSVQRENRLSADSIVSMVEAAKQAKVTAFTVPSDASLNWQVTAKKQAAGKQPKAKVEGGAKPKTYFVNPSTGLIEGEQGGSTSEFFTTVMQLHRWLLMEDYGGRIIVGVATLIFVFMLLSGLVLWFPAKLRLIRQVLTVKTSANWKRVNHDLHNTLGFYSFIVLLVMALTGLCWSFEWYRDGMSDVLGAKVFRGRGEKPMQSQIPARHQNTASLQLLVTSSTQLFPYTGNLRFSIPENDSNAVVATKIATGFFASAGSDKVQFDRYTGSAIKIERFSDKPLNVKIADSIRPIHTGEIFGTFSKLIYLITCLIATSLPVTGTMIWLNKMKKNDKPAKTHRIKTEELV